CDATILHTVTGANPFFVTEVLGARNESVPVTVRESVLARRAALSAEARVVLDFVSIVASRTELKLLTAALNLPDGAMERCITAGLVKREPQAVGFRHELARLAVASALPPTRLYHYHHVVFEALLSHIDRSTVLARIVYHAEACGAVDAIVEYAPVAA